MQVGQVQILFQIMDPECTREGGGFARGSKFYMVIYGENCLLKANRAMASHIIIEVLVLGGCDEVTLGNKDFTWRCIRKVICVIDTCIVLMQN